MLDKIHLTIQGGCGGQGCESFYHRKDHKTIPNGADGGDGGSVIFCTSQGASTIDKLRLKQHLVAESGERGGSDNKRGRKGSDLIVTVPLGTSLVNRETRLKIRDFSHEGEEVIVARGGRGGVGNSGDRQATPGEEGEKVEVDVEFRIIADVFLVGLPSCGKSSLLHRLTRAHVEGKNYPFATRVPILGMYSYDDYKQINFCELPSIYEGSLQGHGLGTEFLKHLAYAKLIVFMLDVVSKYAQNTMEGFATLQKIVYGHDSQFRKIPMVVVVNKIDLGEELGKIQAEMEQTGQPYFLISVKTGEGLESLMRFIQDKIESDHHD